MLFIKNSKCLPFFALYVMMAWALAFSLIKLGYNAFFITTLDNKIFFAGIRCFFAGILLFIYAYKKKKSLIVKEKGLLVKYALFNVAFYYIFSYIGLSFTTGSRSVLIDSIGLFVLILLASLVDHSDPFTKQKALGVLLGFSGLLFMNIDYSGDITFFGDGMILLGSLCGAYGSLLTRSVASQMDMLVAAAWSMFLGGVFLIGMSLCLGAPSLVITGRGLLILLLLIFISASCYVVYNQLLVYHPISKVAIYNALTPVLGVCFSILLLNESFRFQYMIAGLFVSLGVIVINKT